MESSLPKVLHKISGKSLLQRVIDSCVELKPDKIFVITGHKSKEVQKSIPINKKIQVVVQEPQSGTGHAIQVLCKEVKKHEGNLLVLNGDVPLIRPSTLKKLLCLHDSKNADVSLITTKKTNPHGYGRVFLKGDYIERIVEEKDCNDLERENPLINAGVYCFNWDNLSEIIDTLQSNNNQKEIYYFANTDKDHIKNSPQLEVFTDKKIPVLFMVDAVDEFWIQNVNKFKDLEFKSITKGKVDVSKVGEKSNKKDENKKEIDSKINDLINILKTELKETISDVIVSNRLTKSPILLVAEEAGMDINMEKLMKMHNQKTPVSKKILEINPNHPMIVNLSQNLTKFDHKKASNLILDQANILDGNILSNPSAYLENLTEIFIK